MRVLEFGCFVVTQAAQSPKKSGGVVGSYFLFIIYDHHTLVCPFMWPMLLCAQPMLRYSAKNVVGFRPLLHSS